MKVNCKFLLVLIARVYRKDVFDLLSRLRLQVRRLEYDSSSVHSGLSKMHSLLRNPHISMCLHMREHPFCVIFDATLFYVVSTRVRYLHILHFIHNPFATHFPIHCLCIKYSIIQQMIVRCCWSIYALRLIWFIVI